MKIFLIDALMLLFIQAGLLYKKIYLYKVSHIIKNYFYQNIDLIINTGVRNLYLTQSIRLLLWLVYTQLQCQIAEEK